MEQTQNNKTSMKHQTETLKGFVGKHEKSKGNYWRDEKMEQQTKTWRKHEEHGGAGMTEPDMGTDTEEIQLLCSRADVFRYNGISKISDQTDESSHWVFDPHPEQTEQDRTQI